MNIRGQRAKIQVYDDFMIPQEIVDKVCEPFVVVGDGETKYILPKPPDKPIKLITSEWSAKYDPDTYILTLSRPATESEKREILNAINNGEIELEEVK
jgi:hypothetical protein